MTFEFIDTAKNDTLMIISTDPVRPVPSIKLRVQPWLKLAIACICLTQGLRLVTTADSMGILMGLVLLICIPSCCYFGWRDYQALKGARNVRTGELRTAVQ